MTLSRPHRPPLPISFNAIYAGGMFDTKEVLFIHCSVEFSIGALVRGTVYFVQ